MANKHLLSAVVAGAVAWGITQLATAADGLAFSQEVDSCVAAVTSRLDLDRATRVRHLVSTARRTGIGYVLTIETAVFSSDSEKKYETYCVANGSNAPLKFRFQEADI